jgi:hypothetical protein
MTTEQKKNRRSRFVIFCNETGKFLINIATGIFGVAVIAPLFARGIPDVNTFFGFDYELDVTIILWFFLGFICVGSGLYLRTIKE